MSSGQSSSEVLSFCSKYEHPLQAGTGKALDKYKLEQCPPLVVKCIRRALFFLVTAIMLALLALMVPCALGIAVRKSSSAPTVTVKNGSYTGVHNPTYNEDFFLGIPYAQPPVGDLRLQLPQSLNETWSEPREAVEYYPECVGYGVSERCLLINHKLTSLGRPNRIRCQ